MVFEKKVNCKIQGVTSGIGIPSAESLLLAGFDQVIIFIFFAFCFEGNKILSDLEKKVFATARNMKKAAEIKKKLTKKHGKTIGDRLTYVNLDLR